MTDNNVILISQIINSLRDSSDDLEKAFQGSNKEEFEKQKKIILEDQIKINRLLEDIGA